MFTTVLYYNYWEDWELFHKVTFDGPNKLIIINDEVTNINVKEDIYSDWKEWSQVRDNTKYQPAVRQVGGDPTPTGALGATFFTINGWRILLRGGVAINGNVYSDDYASPLQAAEGVVIATSTVSNLIEQFAVNLEGLGVPTAEETAAATRAELTAELGLISTMPTEFNQIPSEVRTELSPELGRLDISVSSVAPAVWEEARASHTSAGSTGEYQSNIDVPLSGLLDSMRIARALLNENSVTDMHTYDGNDNLLTARVRSYDTKDNATSAGATGLLQTFTVTATYDGGGKLTTYRMVREGS